MNLENAEVFDIELFPNLLVIVSKSLAKDGGVKKFVMGDTQDDYEDIMTWLRRKPTLIGFYSLQYDSQVIEYIWRSTKKPTVLEIYTFIQEELFGQKKADNHWHLPYKEWDLSFAHLCLHSMNHYSNVNKMASLKWLEFSMRLPHLEDMPIEIGSIVSASKVPKVVSYCVKDTEATHEFFKRCMSMVIMRKDLVDLYGNPRIMNMSDASIGEFIILHELKESGLTEKQMKKTVPRDTIAIADCILDYIRFETPEFNEVLEGFKSTVLYKVQENGIKGVYSHRTVLSGTTYDTGVGGIHGVYKPGVYISNEENIIMSWDASSFYPWLSIANKFYPQHLGPIFCKIYEGIYNKRTQFAKGTSRNKGYKQALVSIFGKSQSKFSKLYDPVYTLKTTIGGQLSLLMLIEQLAKLGQILLANTDGFEILLPRKRVDELFAIVSEFEAVTGLKMEYDEYSKLVIRDVNAYWAINTKNVIKRKNLFRVYDDFTEKNDQEQHYDESPNETIIADALNEYYLNGTPPEDTVNASNLIYDFLCGVKTRKGFDYELLTLNEKENTLDRELRSERAVRFFVKKDGAFMFKRWRDGRKTDNVAIKKGQRVQTCMNVVRNGEIQSIRKGKKGEPSTVIQNYNPDREYYISRAYEVINAIESGQMELSPVSEGYTDINEDGLQ